MPKRKANNDLFSGWDSDDDVDSKNEDTQPLPEQNMSHVLVSEAKRDETGELIAEVIDGLEREEVSHSSDPGTARDEEDYVAWCGEEEVFLSQKGPEKVWAVSAENQGPDHFFGLGEEVRSALFKSYHIDSLHEWQSEMLCTHIQEGSKNGLIVAPTSGGKTLVALILILRAMLLEKKDCFLVLPYVAIVTEKIQELRRLSNHLPWFSVAEYAGPRGKMPIPTQKSNMRVLYICTPEKASVVWKALCGDEERRGEIGMAVLDECHMLRDNPRGAVLEELIVSLLFWSKSQMMILGLSATVGNPDVIATFLGGGDSTRCNVYNVASRPTQLNEQVVISGSAFPILRNTSGLGSVDTTTSTQDLLDEDNDTALYSCPSLISYKDKVCAKLVFESVKLGGSVLVFCGTRKACVSFCNALTNAHKYVHDGQGNLVEQTSFQAEIEKQRHIVVGSLCSETKGMVSKALLDGISRGFAYHSAELHSIERKAVEDAYRRNIISVLCSTSTLAAGVNLPANRVIIKSPRLGPTYLACSQYLQMVGRAGRTIFGQKKDCVADSFMFLNSDEVGQFRSMIEHPVEDVTSQLNRVESFYQRRDRGALTKDPCTGITRIILGALSMNEKPMKLSNLVRVFRTTLLYQASGVARSEGAAFSVNCTLLPFIEELLALLRLNSLEMLVETQQPAATLEVEVFGDRAKLQAAAAAAAAAADLPDYHVTQEESHRMVSVLERKQFLELLTDDKDYVSIPDYSFGLTVLSAAASAASLSVADAQQFIKEAEELEGELPLQNYLVVLYLSLTERMSLQLLQDPQYKAEENCRRTQSVKKLILRDFSKNPDAAVFTKLGIAQDILSEWVFGNLTVQKNVKFTETLTRLWTALFLKELLLHPDNFEALCVSYCFDRPTAVELTSAVASRCQNLRILCQKLDKLWWYPPLSTHLSKGIVETCEVQYRPLLALRHVTVERAKALYRSGYRTVQEVAAVYPPTVLSDILPYMSRWMAVELVLDARAILAHETNVLAAERAEKLNVLKLR